MKNSLLNLWYINRILLIKGNINVRFQIHLIMLHKYHCSVNMECTINTNTTEGDMNNITTLNNYLHNNKNYTMNAKMMKRLIPDDKK